MRAAAVLAELPEQGSELEQVLALLRASSVDEPETLAVAAGDRRLLALHRALTGRDVELTVTCGCGTVNEVALSEVPDELPRVAVCGSGGGLRAPVYGDLIGLPSDGDEAVAELLRRCTVGTPARAPLGRRTSSWSTTRWPGRWRPRAWSVGRRSRWRSTSSGSC